MTLYYDRMKERPEGFPESLENASVVKIETRGELHPVIRELAGEIAAEADELFKNFQLEMDEEGVWIIVDLETPPVADDLLGMADLGRELGRRVEGGDFDNFQTRFDKSGALQMSWQFQVV